MGDSPETSRPDAFWKTLPRPPGLESSPLGSAFPPKRQVEKFQAGFVKTLGRLILFFSISLRFVFGILVDKVRRRDSQERRGQRLRAILEQGGATLIKLGQQLSIRIDLIPYEFALELEKMLDSVPAFPLAEATASIEKSLGKPLTEVFACLDPEPIGSASISCVYQAELLNGEKVAVKVRRPRIGTLFAADLRALSWLLRPIEAFFFPRGFFQHFLAELESMLFEELDFRREARYTDLFRRAAKKHKLRFVDAPRVYFELSGPAVLVMEFVSGIPLGQITKAAETQDRTALDALEELRIRPKKVARNLLRVSRYGAMEAEFFHADLHPANILVHPGSRLTLIDFGSCGAITERERHLWRRIVYAQASGDVGAMVQAVMGTMEPLPYIDLDTLIKETEMVFWQDLHASRSKHAQWWERTSANLWIGFFAITSRHRIPMHLNTLRMVRVTLLADSLAARLHPKIRPFDEYRRFDSETGKRSRKRLRKKIAHLSAEAAHIGYEQMYEAGVSLFSRLQRFLDHHELRKSQQEKNLSFVVARLARTLTTMTGVTLMILTCSGLWDYFRSVGNRDLMEILTSRLLTWEGWQSLFSQEWYIVFLVLWTFVVARQLLWRLEQKF